MHRIEQRRISPKSIPLQRILNTPELLKCRLQAGDDFGGEDGGGGEVFGVF